MKPQLIRYVCLVLLTVLLPACSLSAITPTPTLTAAILTPTLTVAILTPQPCCTAPACREDEVYFCSGVCPCGCGTTCATKTPTPPGAPTLTPSITPTPITFACVDCPDPRSALRYFCPLAANDETARALLTPYGEIYQSAWNDRPCLYVVKPGAGLTSLYYVAQASSTVIQILIDPILMSTPDTRVPGST